MNYVSVRVPNGMSTLHAKQELKKRGYNARINKKELELGYYHWTSSWSKAKVAGKILRGIALKKHLKKAQATRNAPSKKFERHARAVSDFLNSLGFCSCNSRKLFSESETTVEVETSANIKASKFFEAMLQLQNSKFCFEVKKVVCYKELCNYSKEEVQRVKVILSHCYNQ